VKKYKCIFLGYLEPLVEALRAIEAVDLVSVGLEPIRLKAKSMEQLCKAKGLKYFDASRIRSNEVLDGYLKEGIDIVVVGAFGQMLSNDILKRPKLGVLNFHPSVLPSYRGGSPIEEQILRGDKTGGATLHWMTEGVDEGPIVVKKSFSIGPDDDYASILDRSVSLGAQLLRQLFAAPIEAWPHEEQPNGAPVYPPRKKDDGLVDWSKDAAEISRIVRAFGWREWARAPLGSGEIVLKRVTVVKSENSAKPGTILAVYPKTVVRCGKDAIELAEALVPREFRVGELLATETAL
jgi:methionyl-tRNA formyltransferase